MWYTLLRIFLGVDMALGFFNYVAWSWLFHQPFNPWLLLLSLFATHLPDADMIPYLLLRKRLGLVSHWVVGHHPIFVVPLVMLISYVAAKIWLPDHIGYLVALVTSGVGLHFLHDGLSRLGFPWLSPFSLTQYRFRAGKLSAVPQAEVDALLERLRQTNRSLGQEFTTRTPPLTLRQMAFWLAGLLAVVGFMLR